MNFIDNNRKYIKRRIKVAKSLFDNKLYEDCVNYIQTTATFAWSNFSGYYKLQELEKIIIDIGKNLPTFRFKSESDYHQSKNILHICSNIYSTGGHSALLFNWIKNDQGNYHTLLSTRMKYGDLKEISRLYLGNLPIELRTLEKSSSIENAIFLKEIISQQYYDCIILHIHPDDVICTLAFADTKITFPILYLNHADHTFWFGVTIVDILIQIREINIEIDRKRRNITNQIFCPIIINSENSILQQNIIITETINILSVGQSYKYNPNNEYNFYKEMLNIVTKYPNIVVNIVGIEKESELAVEYNHHRINYLGSLNRKSLNKIENNADIYLEGFPYPSFTSLLEVALKKIPFVLHYNPLNSMKLFNENRLHNIFYPVDIISWRTEVYKMIENADYRNITSRLQYKYINQTYSLDFWKESVKSIYKNVSSICHKLNCYTEDEFYNGKEEKLLIINNKSHISHIAHTYNLPFFEKVMNILFGYLTMKRPNYYMSKREVLYCFFKFVRINKSNI